MTWAWREEGPRATGAGVMALIGLVLLVNAFEPPEGDCVSPTQPRDSPRNPFCIGPLTQPWQVALVAGLSLASLGGAGALLVRGRRSRPRP